METGQKIAAFQHSTKLSSVLKEILLLPIFGKDSTLIPFASAAHMTNSDRNLELKDMAETH